MSNIKKGVKVFRMSDKKNALDPKVKMQILKVSKRVFSKIKNIVEGQIQIGHYYPDDFIKDTQRLILHYYYYE